MKSSIFVSIALIAVIVLAINLKISLEKPKIVYENSLDSNRYGISDSNKEFSIEKGDEIGILLVHGLGATPYQTKELADFLSERNISVYSVRLSGHGTNLTDLESKKWEDWYNDAENAYELLKSKTKKTYILGVSSGASLAAYIAANNKPDGIILIAPPVYLNNTKAEFAYLMAYFRRYNYFGVDKTQIGYAYENLPLKTIAEFVDLIKVSSKSLDKIDELVLIIQSKIDDVVQPRSAQYVFDNIISKQKKILWVDSIKHAIIRPYEDDTNESVAEREKVFNEIYDFVINNEN